MDISICTLRLRRLSYGIMRRHGKHEKVPGRNKTPGKTPGNPNDAVPRRQLNSFDKEKPDPRDSYLNRYDHVGPDPKLGLDIVNWFRQSWHSNRKTAILRYLNFGEVRKLAKHMSDNGYFDKDRVAFYEGEIAYVWFNWFNADLNPATRRRILKDYEDYKGKQKPTPSYDHELARLWNHIDPDVYEKLSYPSPSRNVPALIPEGKNILHWFEHVWKTDRDETIIKYFNHTQVKQLEDHIYRIRGSISGRESRINHEIEYIWDTWLDRGSAYYDEGLFDRIYDGFRVYQLHGAYYNPKDDVESEEEYDENPEAPRVIQGSFAKHSDAPRGKPEVQDFEEDLIDASSDDDPIIQRIQQAIEAAPRPEEEDFGARYEIGDRLSSSFASLQSGMPEPEVEEPEDNDCVKPLKLKKPAAHNLFSSYDPHVDDEDEEDMVLVYVPPKKPAAASSPQPKRMPDPEPNEPMYDPDELTEKERSMLCHSCQERYIRTIIYPCEHMILCVTCAVAWDKKNPEKPTCPSCRTAYTRISKPFFG